MPHSGSMCLLDSVEAWDDGSIKCRAISHRDETNPLRRENRLSALHAVEYGAQAVALHGGLCARKVGMAMQSGYLAGMRSITLHTEWLDQLSDPLDIEADCLLEEGGSMLYAFKIQSGEKPVADGRVTIMRMDGVKQ